MQHGHTISLMWVGVPLLTCKHVLYTEETCLPFKIAPLMAALEAEAQQGVGCVTVRIPYNTHTNTVVQKNKKFKFIHTYICTKNSS